MHLHLISRIELIFWNFAIRALSQSNLTRSFMRKAYTITNGSEITSLGILMAACGFFGLISGYAFYFLTLSMR
jgi:hypothetical protein